MSDKVTVFIVECSLQFKLNKTVLQMVVLRLSENVFISIQQQ